MGMMRQAEDLLDRYLDQFPWVAAPGEKSRFEALDSINERLHEYLTSPEVVAETERWGAMGKALGESTQRIIDKEIMEIFSHEQD